MNRTRQKVIQRYKIVHYIILCINTVLHQMFNLKLYIFVLIKMPVDILYRDDFFYLEAVNSADGRENFLRLP